MLERKPDPEDRRHNRLYLTKKSESVVDSIIETVLQLRKTLYKGLSKDDLELMRPILKRIVDNADKLMNKPKPEP